MKTRRQCPQLGQGALDVNWRTNLSKSLGCCLLGNHKLCETTNKSCGTIIEDGQLLTTEGAVNRHIATNFCWEPFFWAFLLEFFLGFKMSRDQDDYLPLLTPGSQLDLGKGDPVDRSKLNLTWPSMQLIMTNTEGMGFIENYKSRWRLI